MGRPKKSEAVEKPTPETPWYKARIEMHLSRQELSSLAKRAGHPLSTTSITSLEEKGEEVIGKRGLRDQTMAWINYVLGLSEANIDWSTVEPGAPVLVTGEKGQFQLRSVNEDGVVNVFGGERNKEKFRSFEKDRVRLISPTALPPETTASVFETRSKGSINAYGEKILEYFRTNGGAHGTGAIAYNLSLDNGLVTRVIMTLLKSGDLRKVGRGVFELGDGVAPEEAPASTNGSNAKAAVTKDDGEGDKAAATAAPADSTPSF